MFFTPVFPGGLHWSPSDFNFSWFSRTLLSILADLTRHSSSSSYYYYYCCSSNCNDNNDDDDHQFEYWEESWRLGCLSDSRERLPANAGEKNTQKEMIISRSVNPLGFRYNSGPWWFWCCFLERSERIFISLHFIVTPDLSSDWMI